MGERVPFEVIRETSSMRARAEDLRRDGRRIAVVPTMGYLHDGHLSLIRKARSIADVVIVTLFVNPTQFGPNEDLATYPRDEAGDLAKLREAGGDLAFVPDPADMYAAGYQTYVSVRDLSLPMCGGSRPGHFDGVASVVTKLFHLTQPHVAVFGQKDFQQLAIIRRLVTDLDFGIEIVAMPIHREADGLAMSSRNAYLASNDRTAALGLSRALLAARTVFASGERSAAALLSAARTELRNPESSEGDARARLDYLELRDAAALTDVAIIEEPAVLAIAAFVGATRLIDNTVLDPRASQIDGDPTFKPLLR